MRKLADLRRPSPQLPDLVFRIQMERTARPVGTFFWCSGTGLAPGDIPRDSAEHATKDGRERSLSERLNLGVRGQYCQPQAVSEGEDHDGKQGIEAPVLPLSAGIRVQFSNILLTEPDDLGGSLRDEALATLRIAPGKAGR
jgi:hypothetical protein